MLMLADKKEKKSDSMSHQMPDSDILFENFPAHLGSIAEGEH